MRSQYKNLDAATKNVDPRKQLQPSQYISFEGIEKDGPRILFVGNSITLHGVLPEIGWLNNWGMAASAKEKDYVHLCYAHIQKKYPEASFCICQAAVWERSYKTGTEFFPQFQNARDYDADLIILKLSANTYPKDYDETLFTEQFAKLVDFLNKSGKAKVIVCTEFFMHPARDAFIRFASNRNYPLCDLSDLGSMNEMKAIGLFEHSGVAAHPGDLGMQTIAKRICAVVDTITLQVR